MARWTLLAPVALAVACHAGGAAPAPVAPAQPDDAAKEARGLIEEAYGNLRHGDAVGMTPMLASDLFIAGPRAADVGLERSTAAIALGDALKDRKVHKLRSTRLVVTAADGDRSAWITDQIELDGQAYAVAAVAADVGGIWLLTAVEVSRAIPDARVKRLAAEGGLPPLAALPAWKGGLGKDAGNHGAPPAAVDHLVAAAGDAAARGDQLDDDAVFVGSAAGAVIRGHKAIARAWKKQPPIWKVTSKLAGATPDDQLVWVVANVEKEAKQEGAPAEVRRLFAVYQRLASEETTPGGPSFEWRLVLLHEAVVPAK